MKIRLSAFADEIDKRLEKQIEVLKANRVSFVELRSIDGINVKDFTNEQAQTYAKQIEDAGLAVWSLGSPLGKEEITVDFNEYEKTVRRVCEIANIFKTDKIRIFSFFHAYDEKEKVFDYLRKMVKIANEYGVALYHENEKEIYGDTTERVLEIAQNVAGLKFIYDPANYVQVGEKAQNTLALMRDKTAYYHIKDVIAETDELVPAGYGSGEIGQLVAGIEKDTVLTLEPHLAIFEGYAQIDNTEMKNKFHFDSNEEAFNFAAKSLKDVLLANGYREVDDGFEKN